MIASGPAEVANSPARVSAWRAIEPFAKPLIAAVNGMAFGAGCELALVCVFIIAGSNALFGQPEVKIGGRPGDGGSQRPPRKLPPNLASYLLMTGIVIRNEVNRHASPKRSIPRRSNMPPACTHANGSKRRSAGSRPPPACDEPNCAASNASTGPSPSQPRPTSSASPELLWVAA
jgi:hypothetical protein